jgi:exonuclease III
VKLLVWNIQQGGGPRRQRIADSLVTHAPDIVALIEFVPSTAGPLLQSLKEAGFDSQICTKRNGFDYALCVLSKTPISTLPSGIPTLDDSGLWLEISVPAHGFSVGIVHAPAGPRIRMRAFLDALVHVATRKMGDPFLFVGDFNTGIGPADKPMNNCGDVDRFRAIQQTGFSDVWRHINADLIEHTYTNPQTGKRYRIDHTLASPGMLPRIRSCHYSHDERENRVSDHSLLIVEIETGQRHQDLKQMRSD